MIFLTFSNFLLQRNFSTRCLRGCPILAFSSFTIALMPFQISFSRNFSPSLNLPPKTLILISVLYVIICIPDLFIFFSRNFSIRCLRGYPVLTFSSFTIALMPLSETSFFDEFFLTNFMTNFFDQFSNHLFQKFFHKVSERLSNPNIFIVHNRSDAFVGEDMQDEFFDQFF